MSRSSAAMRGRLVILFILALALLASLGSLWYLSGQQRNCLDLWGPEAARMILRAPHARAWRVVPLDATAVTAVSSESGEETVEFAERRWTMLDARDVTKAPGFSHVRQALTHDRVFDWSDKRPADGATWQYAVRFIDGERTATVLFAFDVPRAALLESGATVSTAPAAKAFNDFFSEQFTPAPAANTP